MRISNHSTEEIFAFKSWCSWNYIAIKPADKHGAVVVLGSVFIYRKTLRQLSGVEMGTKIIPSYVILFVGYVEQHIFKQ